MILRRTFLGLALILWSLAGAQAYAANGPSSTASAKQGLDLDNTLYLDLDYGRVIIQMHPEWAPKTVARIKELVRQGFYDGLAWHRVVPGLLAQTGDPKGDGTGGSGQAIPAEFTTVHERRGVVTMARSTNVKSSDSQFVIFLADMPHKDGQYTFWGEVVSGMEFADHIRKGDRVVRLQVAADVEKAHDMKSRP